jgi:imidazolonepropionase-like amidohydrolase
LTEEFAIRARVQPAIDVLRSMWTVNARLCHLEGRIGVLRPGAYGDTVISNVDPIDDIDAFARHETAHSHVIHNGNLVVDRTTS